MLQYLIEVQEAENLKIANKISLELNEKPIVAIINTNEKDEPSLRYINSKKKNLSNYKIETEIFYVHNDIELTETIKMLNEDTKIDFIIVQSPFSDNITLKPQFVFDLILKEKDIDRLRSEFYYDTNFNNLPLTACGIYRLINSIKYQYKENILFLGNGITTNKRLFLKMFDEGKFDCRITNSKTPKKSLDELINWSHIIVASTGIPEILECKDKIVISPTIFKSSDGFRSDLKDSVYEFNFTHKKIGGIGKLTISELIRRIFEFKKNKVEE